MILVSMTATFGKLENETLTLSPGLNLISAPNEWGKSTWCAFLLAMLYGVDTAQRASKGSLPVKERYKPWSGRPMEGRIVLEHEGRSITIERSSRGRVPLGQFRAFETDSGRPVPELTADNCGQTLLGVERSVYERSGFLRLTELPVTADEALMARLNALVTTGSETAAASGLDRQLRELQNRCRHNRTGLLPQAEAERDEVRKKLGRVRELERKAAELESRLSGLSREEETLLRHQRILAAQALEQKRQALSRAESEAEAAEAAAEELERRCRELPEPAAAELAIRELRDLTRRRQAAELDLALLPPPPAPPEAPIGLKGRDDPEKAAAEALAEYRALTGKPGKGLALALLPGLVLLAGGAVLGWLLSLSWGLAAGACGLGWMALGLWSRSRRRRQAEERAAELLDSFGVSEPEALAAAAGAFARSRAEYGEKQREYDLSREKINGEILELSKKLDALSLPQPGPEEAIEAWRQVTACWDALAEARRRSEMAGRHRAALARMAGKLPGEGPEKEPGEDSLSLSENQTMDALTENRRLTARLRSALDQLRGQLLALPDAAALAAREEALVRRIGELEDCYAALGYAQAAWKTAGDELRRQFAPRITSQAAELLGRLTRGRYDRLLWEEDLSLSLAAGDENVLRSALRRSDGTIDQAYLALRLAVCREILPRKAPLVLDDALARFDDGRLAAALEVLKQEARERQILLFTCQSREKALLDKA